VPPPADLFSGSAPFAIQIPWPDYGVQKQPQEGSQQGMNELSLLNDLANPTRILPIPPPYRECFLPRTAMGAVDKRADKTGHHVRTMNRLPQ